MKFLRSSNSVEIWLFCQFDYSKQESGLKFLLLVPVIFLLIFLSTARVDSSENDIVSYSGS
jgi:hypothetical protein